MSNLYIVSDCTSERCYSTHLAVIKEVCGKTFAPRKNLAKTEAVIQVKGGRVLFELLVPVLELIQCDNCKNVGYGDRSWVKTVVTGSGWDSPIEQRIIAKEVYLNEQK